MKKQLLCLGDSITDADRLFSSSPLGNGYVNQIGNTLGNQWDIINRGVNGFTVQRIYEQVCREYSGYRPDAITILVGINDAALMENTNRSPEEKANMVLAFQDTYEKLLSHLIRYHHPHILLMEPFLFPWPASYLNWYPEIKSISERIQIVAEKFSCTYLPLWNFFLEAAKSMGIPALTSDGVHLTSKGHTLLASRILPFFSENIP